jgi:hypothetical protein
MINSSSSSCRPLIVAIGDVTMTFLESYSGQNDQLQTLDRGDW